MTLQFKIEYLEAIRKRYYQARKREKTRILNELCAVAGYNRKYTIRILAIKHHEGKAVRKIKKFLRTRTKAFKTFMGAHGRVVFKKNGSGPANLA